MRAINNNLLHVKHVERQLRMRNIPATVEWLIQEAEDGHIPSVEVNGQRLFRLDAVLSALAERAGGVSWKPTAELIRSRQSLALESAHNGAVAYAFGGCHDSLVGEAVTLALETPGEVDAEIRSRIEGKVLDDDEIDLVVMHCYLLMGIYRAFKLKTSGQLREAAKGAEHGA